MAENIIQSIKIEDLVLNPQNPRHTPQASQIEALAAIVANQRDKLVNLADDIAERGLNPTDLPIVTPFGQTNYRVLEGNRRIAALKFLRSKSLIDSIQMPASMSQGLRSIADRATGTLPEEIPCVVIPEEDARHWINLKHTGENRGIGIVPWDGVATARFRGTSPSLQAIDLVRDSPLIDDDTRKRLPNIAITNVERLLGTPEARAALGVDVKNGALMIVGSDEEGLGRLALVIADIANHRIKVTDLDSKQQRVEYANKIAAQSLPTPQAPARGPNGSKPASKSSTKRLPADRRTLIPKTLKLAIVQSRINQIYHELLRLPVEDYVNCCAVMLRVFVELSIDHYAQTHSISLKNQQSKEVTLRQKIGAVADYMDRNNILTKNDLKGIRSIQSNVNHILSVDSWNSYVHNKSYNPTASDLRANWDTIESFVQALWQ